MGKESVMVTRCYVRILKGINVANPTVQCSGFVLNISKTALVGLNVPDH